MDLTLLAFSGGGVLLGILTGYILRARWAENKAKLLEREVAAGVEVAEARAKELLEEAREKATSLLVEVKREERERRRELAGLEKRLREREELLDRKFSAAESEERSQKAARDALAVKEKELTEKISEVERRLEHVSGLTAEEAREELFRELRDAHRKELARAAATLERERREEIERRALEVITIALQRYARSHISELTTTAFPLHDEELKGKIIGREGRNIRVLERETGVEFVIDEAPDVVIISSFDPLRREVARLALEKLIRDGRIQPAKIEEKVEEARQELENRMREIGEAAAVEVGVYDFPKELLQLLGRLHFRSSFGQNVLTHSIETAHLAGMIAAELGLNVVVAKKGGLVHDIGKAIDHDAEGGHVELGRKILKKYGVDDAVITAMQSHHEDYPYASPEAYVVTAADALSAARPGARRGTLENYLKRLTDLERIATEFPGVKNAYAISAGRELRVFVIPEKVDDFRALELAREIATRIQSELQYPGEIKVNVIREMRAVEYAR